MTGMMWDQTSTADRETNGFLTGVAVGEVTDNKDPRNLARVRVRLPWQAEGDTSFWARAVMPMAGNGRGLYVVPEIGDEVLVAAEQGDPSHLYVLGVLWNGKNPPPENNEDGRNNTRLFRSRSKHEIRFNDDESAPELEVKLADGKRLTLDRDRITVDDAKNSSITISSTDGTITIKAPKKLRLESTQIEIRANGTMSLNSAGTLQIKGAVVQIN